MDTKHFRQSNNVEIDCLGKRTKINSVEAGAAFACQDEVGKMRDQTIFKAGFTEQLRQKGLHDLELTGVHEQGQSYVGSEQERKQQVLEAQSDAGKTFDANQYLYTMKKPGKHTTYEQRLKEFKKFVDY